MLKVELLVWIILLKCLISQTFEDITLEFRIRESKNNSSMSLQNLDGSIRRKLSVTNILRNPEEDNICSPISIIPPLAKLAIGASGKTLQELEEAIGFKRIQVRTEIQKLLRSLENVKGVTINIVTKMFLSNKYNLNSDYKHDIKKIFNTAIERIDFTLKDIAVYKINNWVNRETDGLIKQIIKTDDLDYNTILILLSAVYFEGKWTKSFRPSGKNATFYQPSGLISMKMMYLSYTLNYVVSRRLDAQILEIPFKGGQSSFLLVLPNKRDGLKNVLEKIDNYPDLLNSFIPSMRKTHIFVVLPIFEIMSKINLKPLLKQLNIEGIFKGEGLGNIIEEHANLLVKECLQVSYIKVNEFGVMAASVTEMTNMLMSSPMGNPLKIIADHPFLFYIMVKGEQLFSGVFNGVKSTRNDFDYKEKPGLFESEDDIYGRVND